MTISLTKSLPRDVFSIAYLCSMNAHDITSLAATCGFAATGFSRAEKVDEKMVQGFAQWLKQGAHASMQFLERNSEKRKDPRLLHPGTASIITLLYPWPVQTFDTLGLKIAAYAKGIDYHQLVRQKATPLLDAIQQCTPDHQPRFFCDSAPVHDRFWAGKARLGFIGKNGFLIHPEFGTRFYIAHIFTSLKIENELPPVTQACGTCSACIDHCPTQAIQANRTIDAGRCIAFWTIEAKEDMPENILQKNPGWIFGCDVCQKVCPYNKRIVPDAEAFQTPTDAESWLNMSQAEFNKLFGQTPLARTGLEKIQSLVLRLKQSET